MILSSILALVLASFASPVLAQDDQGPIVFDSIHNATTIYGTWSSGSQRVVTGPVRCLVVLRLVEFLIAGRFHLGICKSCQYDLHLSKNDRGVIFVVREP